MKRMRNRIRGLFDDEQFSLNKANNSASNWIEEDITPKLDSTSFNTVQISEILHMIEVTVRKG